MAAAFWHFLFSATCFQGWAIVLSRRVTAALRPDEGEDGGDCCKKCLNLKQEPVS